MFLARMGFTSIVILLCLWTCNSLSTTTPSNNKNTSDQKYYNYFAFGSNMASSTMTALRNVNPVASAAAVLTNHRLAFNVPGTPFIEPSWASIEPAEGEIAHGVVYKLTEGDFQIVCETEGVPFGYTLHRCRVVPYVGDGNNAGEEALENVRSINSDDEVGNGTISAFTLRASRAEWRRAEDTPPSRAYLNVLIRGAEEFKLDEQYVENLKAINPGKTIGKGIAELMLTTAERRNELSSRMERFQ
eukprot:81493_1